MKSLEEYLRKEDQQKLFNYYDIADIDKWLFETYNEYLANNEYISEDQFYHGKYNFSTLDTPEYWFWQDKLYERLGKSLIIYSKPFSKLFDNIPGIDEVIIDNDYSIGIRYNDEFSETSKEFESLLNFANYFIRSKHNENGKLPNPFFIEGRQPKELIDYRYKKAYHITNIYAYDKIKRYGLLPKVKSKLSNYDYRIYLWIPDNLTKFDIMSYGRIALRLYDESINSEKHALYNKIDVNKDLVLLEIDLEKFEIDHAKQLRLFGDPAYNKKSAVFTQEPIPTRYIEKIDLNTYNLTHK